MFYEIKKIRIDIDKSELELFTNLDPNPLHKLSKNGRNINGCVSGIQMMHIANQKSWSDDIYCATKFNIKFNAPLFPDDNIVLKLFICRFGKIRNVRFYFKKDNRNICIGKIKQIIIK